MSVATWAVLLDLEAVRIVTTVLLGDVVTFLALNACERDLGTDIALGHDRAFQLSGLAEGAARWNLSCWCRTARKQPYSGGSEGRT